MGYEQWWTALEGLIAELRKKQLAIPPEVMTYLRSAKTMISVYNADPSRLETVSTIEDYLLNVESRIMNIAREKLGESFEERWIRTMEKARREESPKTESASSKFILRHPRDQHWVRVMPSDDILKRDVERLADEAGVKSRTQQDGYILVYGSEDKVKDFVKKMAETCRRTRKN